MKVAHVVGSFAAAGDTKSMASIALAQRADALEVAVFAFDSAETPLSRRLIDAGVVVGSSADATTYHADAVIVHRNGSENADESNLVMDLTQAGSRCYEFNTFGRVDVGTDHLWHGHFHPSADSLRSYLNRRGLDLAWAVQHQHFVTGLAVEPVKRATPEERRTARQALDLADQDIVFLRLGRPDLRKWSSDLILAFELLRQRRSDVKLVIKSCPEALKPWIAKRLGAGVLLLDFDSLPEGVTRAVQSADVFVNFSKIGETFGLAMAEGMSSGLPAVANYASSADNAQLSLIGSSERGWITTGVVSAYCAMDSLASDPVLRARMGVAAEEYIAAEYSASAVSRRMAPLLLNLSQDGLIEYTVANSEQHERALSGLLIQRDGPTLQIRRRIMTATEDVRFLSGLSYRDFLRVMRRRLVPNVKGYGRQ